MKLLYWKRFVFIFLFFSFSATKPKLVFSMIMKNEAGRKLRECLESVKDYIDEAVIIDDNSTDNSIAIADEVLKNVPHRIIKNNHSKFSNEINLRKQQWYEAIKSNPDWIMNIDADHVWEKAMQYEIFKLINQDKIDVWCFRLYDFWDENHYRDDSMWCAHNTYRSFLVRYKKNFNYQWKETPQHCGHFPKNIYELPAACSFIRLKHYGWATPEDRIAKYHRYKKLDPECKYGWQAQYDSVLDANPHLVKWIE